jgi:hypothetical protein
MFLLLLFNASIGSTVSSVYFILCDVIILIYVAAWCTSPPHNIHTQPHTTQNFIKQKPKLACNSEDTDEVPEDGTQLSKHAEAAK